MPTTAFEEAFGKITKLAATFQANEARYLSPDYQEAEARKDFIYKFFIALGWDVNHDEQTNPYEQEVKVEQAVSAAGQRRADYAFHLAPNYRDVRFFVEAKKPYRALQSDRRKHANFSMTRSVFFNQHSQMISTFQPLPLSTLRCSRSRSRFLVPFPSQYSPLLVGAFPPCRHECMCQKQP